MEVPRNDNKPQALPLTSPAVRPEYLMMAAAGMREAGNYPAYNSGATFADNELSKNVEDRRTWGDKEKMAGIVDNIMSAMKQRDAIQGRTPELNTQDTATSGRMRRLDERGNTPSDLSAAERSGTVTRR